MLEFLGEVTLGKKLRQTIFQVVKDGHVTKDLGGKLSTSEFTDAVIQKLINLK